MERYIYRWHDANGEIKERLLNEKQFNALKGSPNFITDMQAKRLQIIRVQFDTVFDE